MYQKKQSRIILSLFFFLSGFCFSNWTSRIPSIKSAFGFNDAELGVILLAMPVTSLIGLPFSGWLVAKFDTRIPLTFATLANAISICFIGLAQTTFSLISAICLFSFSLRILNISLNTQALNLQAIYGRKINGSFHGLWSTGGILGVSFSTLMVYLKIPIANHLTMVGLFNFFVAIICYRYLLSGDRAKAGNNFKFTTPDSFILYLGLLVFFTAVIEGGMFDWSGIFFKEVVKEEVFTTGYLIFMVSMALSRFISDAVIEIIGMPKTYIFSSVLVITGMSIAIVLPTFWPAFIGFSLVGFGSGSVIPMTYSLAGTSQKYSTGLAISIIATFGIAGMLLGPPMIGFISEAFNLRISFISFILAALILIPVSRLFFRLK